VANVELALAVDSTPHILKKHAPRLDIGKCGNRLRDRRDSFVECRLDLVRVDESKCDRRVEQIGRVPTARKLVRFENPDWVTVPLEQHEVQQGVSQLRVKLDDHRSFPDRFVTLGHEPSTFSITRGGAAIDSDLGAARRLIRGTATRSRLPQNEHEKPQQRGWIAVCRDSPIARHVTQSRILDPTRFSIGAHSHAHAIHPHTPKNTSVASQQQSPVQLRSVLTVGSKIQDGAKMVLSNKSESNYNGC
jgi:hypothetical protein